MFTKIKLVLYLLLGNYSNVYENKIDFILVESGLFKVMHGKKK